MNFSHHTFFKGLSFKEKHYIKKQSNTIFIQQIFIADIFYSIWVGFKTVSILDSEEVHQGFLGWKKKVPHWKSQHLCKHERHWDGSCS